jgi:6-phosphogluconolactonase
VRVFSSRDEVSAYLIERWRNLFREAFAGRGLFTVALSGGETPRDFYKRLSRIRDSMWNDTHVFLVDERFVPFTHSNSNFGMLSELLLFRVDIPQNNCHPVPVEGSSPEGSAKKYETEIRKFFRLRKNELPGFDLILLGIGEDGHTASLFPGDDALHDDVNLTHAVLRGGALRDRITLTLPVLNNARCVIFLVTGEKKSHVIRKVLEGRDKYLPAALVRPKGSLTFLLDREAAAELRPGSGRLRKIGPGTAA